MPFLPRIGILTVLSNKTDIVSTSTNPSIERSRKIRTEYFRNNRPEGDVMKKANTVVLTLLGLIAVTFAGAAPVTRTANNGTKPTSDRNLTNFLSPSAPLGKQSKHASTHPGQRWSKAGLESHQHAARTATRHKKTCLRHPTCPCSPVTGTPRRGLLHGAPACRP